MQGQSQELLAGRHAVGCAVAAESLRHFGILTLRVTGTSMMPSVWPGDVLSVQRATIDDVATGDVVLVRGNGGLCAHRVVGRHEGESLLTCGDNMDQLDPPVPAPDVLGRVTAITRWGWQLSPKARRNIAWRTAGSLALSGARVRGAMRHLIGERHRRVGESA